MLETIAFGGGCFWCTEAIFSELAGVISPTPGYAGGETDNPTYEQVLKGKTGHAEVTQVTFRPDQITLLDLLNVFFSSHDPATKNRQGPDIGSQYRSIILFNSERQHKQINAYLRKLRDDGVAIATEVKPLKRFYPAEDHHHHYYTNNRGAAYCRLIIDPKLQKLQREFSPLLKRNQKHERRQ